MKAPESSIFTFLWIVSNYEIRHYSQKNLWKTQKGPFGTSKFQWDWTLSKTTDLWMIGFPQYFSLFRISWELLAQWFTDHAQVQTFLIAWATHQWWIYRINSVHRRVSQSMAQLSWKTESMNRKVRLERGWAENKRMTCSLCSEEACERLGAKN